MRDRLVVRALKEAYPTDGQRRVERLRRGERPTDDELDTLHDLILNEGWSYVQFHGKGADYDESDPSQVDLYSIDITRLGGIYLVRGGEFGDSGFFRSLDDAESWVWDHWSGVEILGPKKIRPPFGEKKVEKKRVRNARKKSAKPRHRRRGA